MIPSAKSCKVAEVAGRSQNLSKLHRLRANALPLWSAIVTGRRDSRSRQLLSASSPSQWKVRTLVAMAPVIVG